MYNAMRWCALQLLCGDTGALPALPRDKISFTRDVVKKDVSTLDWKPTSEVLYTSTRDVNIINGHGEILRTAHVPVGRYLSMIKSV